MTTPSGIRSTLAKLTRNGGDGRRAHPAATTPASNAGAADTVAAKLGHLLETEVFATLPESERRWLLESTTMITCKRGWVFYRPDEPAEVVFILKRGRVDLYRLAPDGRKLIVARIDPHTIFGQMALIGQGMYGCYAEAAEECLLCVLSRADLEGLFGRNPAVGLRLLAVVGERLQEREAELEALAFRDLPTRLAALLLREADASGTVTGYSHQALAERLGTYRETVSHLLGRFRAEGLVAVEPRRIRLLDRAGLEAYAEG
jgi:CRP/FNR family transcriptional regulator, cyclic AMP receptor protein